MFDDLNSKSFSVLPTKQELGLEMAIAPAIGAALIGGAFTVGSSIFGASQADKNRRAQENAQKKQAEAANKYNKKKVKIIWKIDARKMLSKNPCCINISFNICKSLKKIKNKIAANGNANANLTYVEAIVEMSLFSFFCKDDLKFWKKAPQTVTNIQFINKNLFV